MTKFKVYIKQLASLTSQYDGEIEAGEITLNREIGTFDSITNAANAAMNTPEAKAHSIFDIDFDKGSVFITLDQFMNGTRTMWEDGNLDQNDFFSDPECTKPASKNEFKKWENNKLNLWQKTYFIGIEALSDDFDQEEFEDTVREITGF